MFIISPGCKGARSPRAIVPGMDKRCGFMLGCESHLAQALVPKADKEAAVHGFGMADGERRWWAPSDIGRGWWVPGRPLLTFYIRTSMRLYPRCRCAAVGGGSGVMAPSIVYGLLLAMEGYMIGPWRPAFEKVHGWGRSNYHLEGRVRSGFGVLEFCPTSWC